MPPADHVEQELTRLRDSQHDLRRDMNVINLGLVKTMTQAKDEIMATITEVTNDQNRRLDTLNADWNEKHTKNREDIAALNAKSAMIGFFAGTVVPFILWLIDHLSKQ